MQVLLVPERACVTKQEDEEGEGTSGNEGQG